MKRMMALLCFALMLAGCSQGGVTSTDVSQTQDTTSRPEWAQTQQTVVGDTTVETVVTSGMDLTFSSTPDKQEEGSQPSMPIQSPALSLPATITKGGSYRLQGDYTDASLTVNAPGQIVELICDGIRLQNKSGPAVLVQEAERVDLVVKNGTTNEFSDGAQYAITQSGTAVDAALFSKADLQITGDGTLSVKGNYKHGIVSKDQLIIEKTSLRVSANGAGVEGKDCVKVNGGALNVTAASDGIRATNLTETNQGFVYIKGGNHTITAGNDGIQAQSLLQIEQATCKILAGGGSGKPLPATGSYKGMKAGLDIRLQQADLQIDAADDGIHSDGTVTVTDGRCVISSGQDGVQAATDIAVSGANGELTVKKSLEGLEGRNLVLAGGRIQVTATKNGLNAKGALTCSDVYVAVSAPCAFDYKTQGMLSRTTLLAAGDEFKDPMSCQNQGVFCQSVGSQNSGNSVIVQSGNQTVAQFAPTVAFTYVYVTTPSMQAGQSYTLQAGSTTQTVQAQ